MKLIKCLKRQGANSINNMEKKVNPREVEAKKICIYMIAPAIITVLFVVAFPMLYSFLLSFTNFSILNTGSLKFVGLNNYLHLLKDKVFLESITRTIAFLGLSISIEFVLGFGIALLFIKSSRTHGVARTLLMIPMMFVPVLVGFQFKWFFNDQAGLINNLIHTLTGSNKSIAWLVEPGLGFFSILTAEIWMSTPFMILVLLAGLASIPKEPFEAATVDGASSWQQFKYITLPLMGPYIYIAVVIRSLDIARSYDVVRIMTDGGPANRTELIWTYIYRLGITSNKFGMGSAMSFVTVSIAFLLTIFLFRQLNRVRSE